MFATLVNINVLQAIIFQDKPQYQATHRNGFISTMQFQKRGDESFIILFLSRPM